MAGAVLIRAATHDDRDPVWRIFEPVIRAGDTYTRPRDALREEALAYWFGQGHEVFVAEDSAGSIVGTYSLRPNHAGGGSHIPHGANLRAAAARSARRLARFDQVIRHAEPRTALLTCRRRSLLLRKGAPAFTEAARFSS